MNPYHDKDTGEFTTKEGASAGSPSFVDEEAEKEEFDLESLLDDYDEEEYATPTIQLTDEQREILEEMGYGEVEMSLLNQFSGLDNDKIMNADEEELKKLLSAQVLLIQKEYELSTNETLADVDYFTFEIDGEVFTASKFSELTDSEKREIEKKAEAKGDIVYGIFRRLKDKAEEYKQEYDKIVSKYAGAEEMAKFYEDPFSPYSPSRKNKAVWLRGDSRTAQIFGEKGNAILNKLREIDESAYDSVVFYTNSPSIVNEPLREVSYGGGKSLPYDYDKVVSGITSAIDSSELEFDCWVERGTRGLDIPGAHLSPYMSEKDLAGLIGREFKQQSFYSSSVEKGKGFDYPIMLYTYCPAGTKGLYVDEHSSFEGEKELILQRGYSYRITRARKQGGKICLDVEVVLGSDSERYNDNEVRRLGERYL